MKRNAFIICILIVSILQGCMGGKKEKPDMNNDSAQAENVDQDLTETENDTSLWEEDKQKEYELYQSLPKISKESIQELSTIIRKWTNYYKIDISEMRIAEQDSFCFSCPADTESLYFRGFSAENDSPSLKWMDYAPDKQRYIDVGYLIEEKEGKYYCYGWDDSQNIYLVDRKAKRQDMILSFGTIQFGEAVFWVNNDVFVVVGYKYDFLPKRFIYRFDIPNETETVYELLLNEDTLELSNYMNEINLKEKGVIAN